MRGNLPAYKSAKVVDDHTIDVEITDNYPLLLNDLTNIVIFDKEWLVANNAEKPTDFGKGVEGYATNHANGTGPFEITERKPDAQTVFVKNPNWWDKPRHNIDKIISRRSPRRRRVSRRCCPARSTSPTTRRCRTCRACRPART